MRRNTLYAPRIRGDLDLGLEPSRVQGTDQEWARIDTPGGRVPGGVEQETYELSVTQNFRVGTRRVQDDRVFRYGSLHGDNTIVNTGRPVISQSNCPETGANGGILTLGAYTMTWTVQAAAGIAADEYAGGMMYSGAGGGHSYRIRSNTAGAAGDVITFTFWTPIREAQAANTDIPMILPSIYRLMAIPRIAPWANNPGLVVGIQVACNPADLTVGGGYFCWVQTWGPCCVMVNNITQGDAINEHGWIWNPIGAGAVSAASATAQNDGVNQYIGDNIPRNVANNVSNQFAAIYLKISP